MTHLRDSRLRQKFAGLLVGLGLTVASGVAIVVLLLWEEQFHPLALLAIALFFQLSLIWTCAELIDRMS